jgi:RNA polymerase sigma-70 factor (ECF subfamily)
MNLTHNTAGGGSRSEPWHRLSAIRPPRQAAIADEGFERVERYDAGTGATERGLAFQRLTATRLGRAYRLAAFLLRDSEAAQDAVHDAAVLAWTRFAELRDESRFDAWFDRIVVNVCRQRMRRGPVRELTVEAPLQVAADQTTGRAEREALRRALDHLTPEHRLVVVLRHLEDLSIAEIAARIGEREGTVKSRLHYALRELRAAYEAGERDPEGFR